MFARIVTFQGKPNQVDAGIRNQREQVLPTVKKMSGFKGGYFADRPQERQTDGYLSLGH
jgi:hypothetical protein